MTDPTPRQTLFHIAGLCLAIRVGLQVIGMLSLTAAGQPMTRALSMWSQWDAPHYLRIAEVGYRQVGSPGDDPLFIVFFPFFPALVFIVGLVVRNLVASGLIVSYAASVGAGYFLYRLVRLDGDHHEARRAVMLLYAFPTAYFLAAPYTEALFLLAVVACMYAARTARWPRAGMAGALATGTRVVGVALAPALLVEAWQQRGSLADRAKRVPWIAVAGIGLVVYLLINQIVHGDPFHFLDVQRSHWYQRTVWPWEPVVEAIRALRDGGMDSTREFIFIGRLAGFVFAVVVLIAGLRKVRASDAFYAWAGFVLIMSASWLISLPRYLLVLYPIFLIGARVLRSDRVLWPVLAGSAGVQGWLMWRYAVGAWTF